MEKRRPSAIRGVATQSFKFMHNLLKTLCFALVFLTLSHNVAHSKDYYIDSKSASASDSGPGSRALPWKSLNAVSARQFLAGDAIYLARGAVFTGSATLNGRGAAGAPIFVSAFGKGKAPILTNGDYAHHNGIALRLNAPHVVVEQLHFRSTANLPDNHPINPISPVGAIFIEQKAQDVTVRDCEFVDTPVGIHSYGEATKVLRNHLHYDSPRPLSNPYWGPIGIFIGGAGGEIAYNRITNFISTGGAFGADGGAIELDSGLNPVDAKTAVRNLDIHHNVSIGNEGFIESVAATRNVRIAYNTSDDFQQFIIFGRGTDTIVENNTVVRTRPKNSDFDWVFTFNEGGHLVRGNIFVVRRGLMVFGHAGECPQWACNWRQTRQNNLYFSIDSTDPVDSTLGSGEKIADPMFVDLVRGDYRLMPGSPAIDLALPEGYDTDLSGNPAPGGSARDAGAYEFQGPQ